MAGGEFILDYVENDLLPFLDVEWEGQDITGFTINLNFRKPNGTKVIKTAIIDDANAGGAGSALFHFEWASGDLCPGESLAEIEVIDGGALNETFQGIILKVAPEVA